MRLAEQEAQMARERGDARRWLREHEGDLPHIAEDRSADRPQERVVQAGSLRDRIVSLLADGMDRATVYDEATKWVPLSHGSEPLSLDRAQMSARVEHVLQYIPEDQSDLLWRALVAREAWQTLRNGQESKQAVFQRLNRARLAFLKAWVDHAEDEVVLTSEDF